MVIICPECSTKFKINPDRIPEHGTKVRCARCKAVFAVEKEAPQEEPESEVPAQTEPELNTEPTVSGEPETTPKPANDFSYERFQELDTQPQDDDFSFSGSEVASTDKTDTTPVPAADEFSFSEPEQQKEEEELAAAPEPQEKMIEDTPEEAPVKALEQEEEKEAEQLYQHLAEKKSSPVSSIIRVLLLLILAILVAVGVFVYINGPDKLNDTIQQLLGQETTIPEPSGQITLTNLEGKFLTNEHVGEVFLIRGEAINNYSQARSSIQVKGIIFDQSGQPLLQKTVFCGNPVADAEIANLPFEELEKMMGNQFGKNLSNMKVNAKQTIPFDIIFKDLPKNLSEFSVNVTASKPANE